MVQTPYTKPGSRLTRFPYNPFIIALPAILTISHKQPYPFKLPPRYMGVRDAVRGHVVRKGAAYALRLEVANHFSTLFDARFQKLGSLECALRAFDNCQSLSQFPELLWRPKNPQDHKTPRKKPTVSGIPLVFGLRTSM